MPEPTRKYALTADEWSDIRRRFTYQPPRPDQIERYQEIRDAAKRLVGVIAEDCPPCREKSLAITNLEQTVMWANAAIARNEASDDD